MYYSYISMNNEMTEVEEPATPKIEIHVCPVCLKNCEGKTQLLEHFWGYCLKTQNYFKSFIFPEKA
jgi:hypothetical protein